MKISRKSLTILCSLGIALSSQGVAAAADVQTSDVKITLIKDIALPGQPTKGDEVTADPEVHKVYVSQKSGNNMITVIDSDTNTVITSIKNILTPNGVKFTKDYLFASAEGDNTIDVISKKDWTLVKKVPTGGEDAPDEIYSVPEDHVVVATNDKSNTMTFISNQAPFGEIGRIKLPDSKEGPDLGVYVPEKHTIYQSEGNKIVLVNPKTREIGKTWDYASVIAPGKVTKGMFYDPVKNILWSDTTDKWILALNADTGEVIAKVPATSNQDQMTGDLKNRVILSGEETPSVGAVVDIDTMKALPDLKLGGGVHTLDVMPTINTLYALEGTLGKVSVYKIERTQKTVPQATSPVTGIPIFPIAAASVLLIAGGTYLLKRRQIKL